MAKRRKGRPLDGILLLDKPAGVSSNGALQRVKRLYNAAKAGHTGSLDPLATGVLPICFGEGTKFSQFLLSANKAYTATIVLGCATTTGDADGEEVSVADASAITRADVEKALDSFRGEIEQQPSMYSAIKVDGKALYKLAREGKEVERPVRRVTIFDLALLDFRPGASAEVDIAVSCTKGTYIRSIAEDLGSKLGCGGHIKRLCRTAVGEFSLEDAVSMESLQALRDEEAFAELDDLLLPMSRALEHLPTVVLGEDAGFYLQRGQPVLAPHLPMDGLVSVVLESGQLLGVGEILDDGRVAPRRLVNTG